MASNSTQIRSIATSAVDAAAMFAATAVRRASRVNDELLKEAWLTAMSTYVWGCEVVARRLNEPETPDR